MEYEPKKYRYSSCHTNKRLNDITKIEYLLQHFDSLQGTAMLSFPTHMWELESKLRDNTKLNVFVGLEKSEEEYLAMCENRKEWQIPINIKDKDYFEMHRFQQCQHSFGYIELDWMGPWCQQKKDALIKLAKSTIIKKGGSIILSINLMGSRECRSAKEDLFSCALKTLPDHAKSVTVSGTLSRKMDSYYGWSLRVHGVYKQIYDIFDPNFFKIEHLITDYYKDTVPFYHSMFKITKLHNMV